VTEGGVPAGDAAVPPTEEGPPAPPAAEGAPRPGDPGAERIEIPIRWLDDDLVVVSKPGHISVHRGPRSEPGERFVLQTVRDQLLRHLFPVHRLDRQTSGLLAFGLSKELAAGLQASLQAEDADKRYLVLCRGETPEAFVSDRPLGDDKGVPQDARTEFRRLATFSRCSLLEARLFTGRTHQIRRHLDHLAHQVIGDTHHGKGRINRFFRDTYGLPRMFLHAWRLAFRHPRSGEPLELVDPLPADLLAFVRRLPDAPAELRDAERIVWPPPRTEP
jgi:tRNA pseudouridine65 synthase